MEGNVCISDISRHKFDKNIHRNTKLDISIILADDESTLDTTVTTINTGIPSMLQVKSAPREDNFAQKICSQVNW